MWSGSTPIGFGMYEKVYVRSGKKLKEYLVKDDKYTSMETTCKKNGKTISAATYNKLTKRCKDKGVKTYNNSKKNRRLLKKGKLKVG